MPIDKNPSPRELRWFGLALLGFFGILGGMIAWRTDQVLVPRLLWSFGGTLVLLYYLVPRLRRPVFVTWTTLTHPIGWILTHLTLAIIYYGLITPVGLVRRVLGRDPMGRRFDPDRSSYWVERPPTPEASRYFRQF